MAIAKSKKDSRLFKLLNDGVWYFRAKHYGMQYRMFAFWDKTDKTNTLVIATHGAIKKSDKPAKSDLNKVKVIREKYFETKKN